MNKLKNLAWVGTIAGFIIVIIANIKMRQYPGYLEIHKAARNSVWELWVIGLVLLLVAYFFTFSNKK